MKKIRILALNAGGTLGMVGKPLRPAKSAEELFDGIKVPDDIELTLVDFPLRIDSTNMFHADRVQMALTFAEHYDNFDAGFLLQGTDSQAETTAVLCMAYKRSLQKCIFVEGAQNTKDEIGSEVSLQLENTMRVASAFARHGKVGVYSVCMSDVWDGSRLRKQRERDLEYVDTPGRHPVAKTWPDVTLLEGGRDFDAVQDVTGLQVDTQFERRVFSTIEVRADSDPTGLTLQVDSGRFKGVILVCKGAGQLPDKPWRDENGNATLSWVEAVQHATNNNVAVGVVSPFQDGEVLFDRYELGRKVEDAGGISLVSLTPDMADVKFRNGLALYGDDRERLKKFIATDFVGELLPRKELIS